MNITIFVDAVFYTKPITTMRRLQIFTLFSIAMLISLTSVSAQDHRYDAGVSRELAEWRKATIKDVRYELYFDLMMDRGVAWLHFNIDEPQEVIIDLRNTDLVSDVILADSGESIDQECTLANEHIVVPASETRAGRNAIGIIFSIDNQSLNRKPDFLYTLLVPDRARTLFPCFDQPDMKATYELHLVIPEDWVAISNTATRELDYVNEWSDYYFDEPLAEDMKVVSFEPT